MLDLVPLLLLVFSCISTSVRVVFKNRFADERERERVNK